MPDYQKSKIYKIVDANEEMVYVGSTVKTLSQRMSHHRSSFKSGPFTTSHNIFNKYVRHRNKKIVKKEERSFINNYRSF